MAGISGTVLAYDGTNRYFENRNLSSGVSGGSSSGGSLILDQDNSAGGSNSAFNKVYLSQTFVCGRTGYLKSVELYVATADIKTLSDITVKIETTTHDGKPSGIVLATATIPGFDNSNFAWKNATFSNPPHLTAGTKYAIVIEPSMGEIYRFEENTDGYANGEVGTSKDGSNWSMDPSYDLLFKTWMEVEQNNGGGNSIQLPSPPLPPIPPGNAVSTCTRNVLIRHPVLDGDHYIYVYEPAQMLSLIHI
mgnify:CR=1 FL=1